MNKLEKHLQDIKGVVAMMQKMNSIDAAAHKILTEALDEALQIHNVSGSFSADDMQEAYNDGAGINKPREFDIENYR